MKFKIKNVSLFVTIVFILSFAGYDTISKLSTIPANPVAEMNNAYSTLSRYDSLSSSDKELYNGIYKSVLALSKYRHSSRRISDSELNNIFYILNYCVLTDHPEIFWVNGNISESNGIISFEYSASKEDVIKYSEEIENIIEEAIQDADLENANDYEKALWGYEWIINNIEYNYPLAENEKIDNEDLLRQCWGAFIEGSTVCEGYSKAYSMLMKELNIPCICVTGNSAEDGDLHEWNVVTINSVNCHIDTTWGDSDTEIDYKYFAQSEEEIAKEKTKEEYSVWPECNSTEYSYYRQNNYYLEQMDIRKIEDIVYEQVNSGNNPVQIQFSSSELLTEAIEEYIDSGIMYDIFTDLESEGFNITERTYFADENAYIIYLYY